MEMSDPPGVGLVLDCRDPESLAPFWAEALGYVLVGSVENYLLLMPDGRPGPKLLLQRVGDDKVAKNRMHIDIEVPDIDDLAIRLQLAGGRRTSSGDVSEHGSRWIVMADPEGNEFCICEGGSSGG